MSRQFILNRILTHLRETSIKKLDFWQSLYCKRGGTQTSESVSKTYVKEILDQLRSSGHIISYEEASSQKHGDFCIKYTNETKDTSAITLECKKSDSYNIICNDTLPSDSTDYLVFFTAKKTKKYKSDIFLFNGSVVISESDKKWIKDYQDALDKLKILVKENAKGYISAYPRPTWKFTIKHYLQEIPKPDKVEQSIDKTIAEESVNDSPVDQETDRDSESMDISIDDSSQTIE